jgi:glutathione S-transferase
MRLIVMFDSPFVRRVAVSFNLCGRSFEHGDWSVGADFERIRRHNPLSRVPTLVLGADAAQPLSGTRPFFGRPRPDPADVTTTCVTTFLNDCFILPDAVRELPHTLQQLNARGEALPAFRASDRKWFAARTQ